MPSPFEAADWCRERDFLALGRVWDTLNRGATDVMAYMCSIKFSMYSRVFEFEGVIDRV